MRIEYLRMKNFAPIFVALDKTEVFLDYRPIRDKVINIFVGQMGTCKTFLLGHHQPYATLGTLDVRNAEDMVLPDKRGEKIIAYRNGDDLIEITHYYVPTKTGGHSIKSYIRKNGNELNENGNNNSFRTIVEAEFGLDQNYLKLFRIGSNVTNLPDMTSTDRKNFIASMLSETEMFQLLYKKIGDENRNVNAQMTLLVNKLQALTRKSEEDIVSEQDAERVIVSEINDGIATATSEIYRLEGLVAGLRNSMTEDDHLRYVAGIRSQHAAIHGELQMIVDRLDAIKDTPDPKALNAAIAKTHAKIDLRRAEMTELDQRIRTDEKRKAEMYDKLAVMGNADHIETLKKTYATLVTTQAEYEQKLKGFTYEGSMGSIISLMNELESLNVMILDLAQFSAETIKEIMRNPRGAVARVEREAAKARREMDDINQELSNITQATTYRSTHLMVRPLGCPTPDCPYYQYHPLTEQRKNRGKNVDAVFLEKRGKLKALEAIIYKAEEYPAIARKIEAARGLWKELSPKAKTLGALKEEDLQEIITNLLHREWYDLKRLNRIMELCGIREKYYELTQRMNAMRTELAQYEMLDNAKLRSAYDRLCDTYNNEVAKLESLEEQNKKDEAELERLNAAYLQVSSIETMQSQKKTLEGQLASLDTELSQLEANLAQIDAYKAEISEIKVKLAQLRADFKHHTEAYEKITRLISDYRLTKEQYSDVLKRQGFIRDVLDAVSSKKGIPLVFVRLFLADCKDIVNDLIADVFDDVLEIQKFDIPEDGSEFLIPYTRNGALISDIIKSSQGESAVISLALAFALIRQATFSYNIMLLDEVDGALHKDARNKFVAILFKQLQAIQAEQVFIVSHNNTFDGYNVNVIMTSDEMVDENPLTSVMRV